MSNNSNNNMPTVPEAKQAMNAMKYEVADSLGITLNKGYNGNISAKDAGHIGGQMVKRMIQAQESKLGNKE